MYTNNHTHTYTGIDHDSVDAWYTPQFFNMDKKTGAPPDDYAEMGQVYIYIYACIYTYIYIPTYMYICTYMYTNGVATISRLLKIIGLFGRI